MKKIILLLSVIVLTAFCNALFAKHNHGEIKINTKISNVDWIGKKVTGQHNGSIKIKEGMLKLHDGHVSGGTIVIDMTSITNEDLKDKGYNKKLIEISVDGDSLIIEGKSNSGNPDGFNRKFTMYDSFDVQEIEASVVDGVLTLLLPYLEEVKPKKVKVKVT